MDVRGNQVGDGPEFFDLSTAEAQRRHWQNVVRTYRFRLPFGGLEPRGRYVLSATYQPGEGQAGTRLFDRLVVLPGRGE